MPKITDREPAERLHRVDLSDAEILALVKWHSGICRRCSQAGVHYARAFGPHSVFAPGETMRDAAAEVKAQHKAHADRATALATIIKLKGRITA